MLIRRVSSPEGTVDSPFPGAAGPLAAHVLAPAKINLYLEVLGRRPDGYHHIETLMLAVELFDEIALARDASGLVRLSCDDPELTVGPDNLVLKAAKLLQERTGCPHGANIRLTKRIPWAAGLGGGSSDAAATLAGLNEVWELGLSTPQLAALGAELGSDVPFFFHAPAAWCTGRGEEVEPAAMGRSFELVLVKPPQGISTAEVYRQCDSRPIERRDGLEAREALATGDVERLARSLHNRLQAPAMQICPPVAEAFRRLQASGAAGCSMTGSGSCLFALCRDEREAVRVTNDLQSGRPSGDELANARVFHVRSCR
jgi:4-diphosphocytidyl-2-C-methyl-D-erythritol kinase